MEDKTLKFLLLLPVYLFIIIGVFVAYNQYQLQKKIGDNPCWACGMYHSKSCTFVLPSQDIRDNKDKLQSFLTDLAEKNSEEGKATDYSYLQPSINLTIPKNISLP